MKRFTLYTAIVFALSLAASCNIIEDTDSGRGLIRFAPKTLDTKAMVDNDNVAGETFTVVDLLTTGTGNSTNTSTHINTNIKYNNGKWEYDPAATYYWNTGTHKFFGYTAGIGQMSNAWKLTIPATGTKTITTADASQTDMLYSSIVTTTADAWTGDSEHDANTPVTLKFHHLLSAISITLENYTGTAVTVNSVTVTLPNKASATVDFGVTTTEPTVAVSTVATDGVFHTYTPTADNATLADQAIVDVLTGTLLTTSDAKATPFMIWPQTLAEDAATISIQIEGEENPRTVSIPKDTEWEAGVVNAYNLKIYPETITLNFKVQPWEKKTIDVDTDLGSINMSNVTWMNFKVMVNGEEKNTLDNDNKSVYMYAGASEEAYHGYYPAQGYFTVNYPRSGQYRIGLIPAYGDSEGDYFDEDAYEIWIYDSDNNSWSEHNQTDGEDISINTVYFQVRAASGQDGAQHKAQINIWFLPDESDEWISAYSEVRATYSLIIPASN